MILEEHIDKIVDGIEDWLRPDNHSLKKALDRTVEEKLFSFSDIKHQILHLKDSLTRENLFNWAEMNSSLHAHNPANKTVLCLHAGNLPLVGLQDLLAVTITGTNYRGKLSRKDPWLLPTLIEKLDHHEVAGQREYSVDLKDFKDKKANALLFAGSEKSAEDVVKAIGELNIANSSIPRLMRTAHYSIAYISDHDKKTMEDLTESVFRYGGTGCRSVGIVVAPFGLNSQKCHFTDYAETFWLKNPQLQKPDEDLFYRYAANKAVGIEQAWLDDFLIEETEKKPDNKFILHWVRGDEQKLFEIIQKYRSGLQTLYTKTGKLPNSLDGSTDVEVDKLANAQKPDIWWKPDGTDPIQWITDQFNRSL